MIVRRTTNPSAFLAKVSAAAAMFVAASAAHAGLVTIPASGLHDSPGVYTPGGFYTNTLGANIVTTGGENAANVGQADGRNDDGFMALDLGFNVSFFGQTYHSLFINNNGSVSFTDGVSKYVPTGLTGVDAPIISPFFDDVDTRNAASDVVYYNLSANQLVVTWNKVGYFDTHADATNNFQLVLRGDDYAVPNGEGQIGFFYQNMDWAVTNTSEVAAVGFGDGNGNGETIEGSLQPGMDHIVNNKYVWFDAKLDTVPPPSDVPEPSSLALIGLGLFGACMSARKKRK